MRKQSKNRAKKKKHCLLFTMETLTLAQQSLLLFQDKLKNAPKDNSNVQFAWETFHHLQEKLRSLVGSYDPTKKISFDYNEVVLLHGSLQMYRFIMLEFAVPSPQIDKEKRQCHALIAYFYALLRLSQVQKRP